MKSGIPTLASLFFGRLADLSRRRRAERRIGRKSPQLEPLESRVLFSADLVGALEWDAGAAPQFPGAHADAVVHVENVGDAAARGGAKVSVYASADGVLDADDVLLGSGKVHGKLKAGASADVDVGLDFDTDLLPGEYQLIALVDSGHKVSESDETNNTALGPIFDFAWKFGDLPGHQGGDKLSFQDADGTRVQLRIVGAGTGELTWDGAAWDLLVTGTDAHSKLFIQTNGQGDGRFSLDDLHVEGPLGALLARTTDLTGTLETDEALRGQLVLGSATGAFISVPMLGTASGHRGEGEDGDDDEGGHGFGHRHHEHERDSGPQGITILGDLVDSQIRVGSGNLGTLVIAGSMISSTVSVGQDPVDGIFDNGDDVLRDGRIHAVRIFGDMSDDSRVVARELPKYAFVDHHFVKTQPDPRFISELTDQVAPTVTIDQAAGQADPTAASPIEFSVVFSETVFGFGADDIDFAGSTAGGTLVASVSGSGANYTVSVSGMTSDGLVVASIGAGAAADGAGNASLASTSTDNSVTFAANVAPVAVDDTASSDEDTAVPIDLLINDVDPDGDPLTLVSIDGQAPSAVTPIVLASGARVTQVNNGLVSYDPGGAFDSLNIGQTGTDSFTYLVTDGNGGLATATAVITLTGVDDAPVANDDAASTDEDTATIIDLLANDTDVDDAVLTVTSIDGRSAVAETPILLASGATLTPHADGTVTYNPGGVFDFLRSGDTLLESFDYVIDDGHGLIDVATVAVTVTGVNDAPVAQNDLASTNEDSPVDIPVLANDLDVEGDALAVASINGQAAVVGTPVALSSGAQVTLLASGELHYDPSGAFEFLKSGTSADDVFLYTVVDGHGGAAGASVSVRVDGVDDAPVLAPIGDQTVNEGTTLSFTVSATDVDTDPTALAFSLDAGAPDGATIDPDTGDFAWTPSEAQGPGDYSITVRVTDDSVPGLQDAQTFLVTVKEVNVAPVLGTIGNRTVDEGSPLTFTATATDADQPSNTLVFSLDAGAPDGASINPVTGAFSWTPTEAQGPGNYAITIRVTDNGTPALDDFETFNVAVNEVNQAPVLDQIGDLITLAQTYSFQVTASDADLPANTLTYSLVGTNPAWASITTGGLVTLTPSAPADYGTAGITVRVTDDGGLFDEQTFNVSVVARPIVALDDALVVEGDGAVARFRVILSGPAPVQGVTVNYANNSIVDSRAATAGTDFTAVSGVVTFAQGETVKTFDVPILNDTAAEFDERFQYILSSPVNAVLLLTAKPAGDAIILDDDTAGTRIAIERRTVFEGDSGTTNVVFHVLLSRPSATEVQVNYSTVNGTASQGADFVFKSGTLTFAPGEVDQTVSVAIIGDTIQEADSKTFGVQLSSPVNATLASLAVQNVNLLNDDGPGLLTAATLGSNADVAAPTTAQLNATLDAAIALWADALGPSDPRLALLDGLSIELTDFSGTTLGSTSGSTILIDSDAAGYGWFVDLTPAQNEEFRMHADGSVLTATPRSEAFGRMDLLTAVLHEIGHALGFTHADAAQYSVMQDALDAGTRYTLGAPRFDFDSTWAGGASGAIAWDAWGSDWAPAHKPRGSHAERHLPGFLLRL